MYALHRLLLTGSDGCIGSTDRKCCFLLILEFLMRSKEEMFGLKCDVIFWEHIHTKHQLSKDLRLWDWEGLVHWSNETTTCSSCCVTEKQRTIQLYETKQSHTATSAWTESWEKVMTAWIIISFVILSQFLSTSLNFVPNHAEVGVEKQSLLFTSVHWCHFMVIFLS